MAGGTRLRLLALAALLAAACAGRAPPARSLPSTLIVRHQLPNGEVRLAVRSAYSAGEPVVVDVEMNARTGAIRGPLGGQVLTSGLDGERVVHALDLAAFAERASSGESATARIVWDGRTDGGGVAPPDTYVFRLAFATRPGEDDQAVVNLGATLHLVGGR